MDQTEQIQLIYQPDGAARTKICTDYELVPLSETQTRLVHAGLGRGLHPGIMAFINMTPLWTVLDLTRNIKLSRQLLSRLRYQIKDAYVHTFALRTFLLQAASFFGTFTHKMKKNLFSYS